MQHELDAKGLICPLPVLKARKKLLSLAPGDILRVEATDKAAIKDFGLFCAEAGHELVSIGEHGTLIEVVVRRGPDR